MNTFKRELKQIDLRFDLAVSGITKFLAGRRNTRPFEIKESTTNSFKAFKLEVEANKGKMFVSSEGCENTIYGNSYLNILARAWHDEVHLALNLGFSLEEEFVVADRQAREVFSSTEDEQLAEDMSKLIELDIKAQGVYYDKYKEFVPHQYNFVKRLFIVSCLNASSKEILGEING